MTKEALIGDHSQKPLLAVHKKQIMIDGAFCNKLVTYVYPSYICMLLMLILGFALD